MEIWSVILKSNTFNFLIMVAICVAVVRKLNLSQKLDDTISNIKESIENSEIANQNSLEELKKADEQTKNVENEIAEIEQKGQENLSSLKDKISADTEFHINSIKLGADKIIDAKGKEIVSNLSKKTVLASIEIARQHIINLLKQHPDYHQKFIKESIEELNGLK